MDLIAHLKQQLSRYAPREFRVNGGQFEKDHVENWVLKAAIIHAVSKDLYKKVKDRPKPDILRLCDLILASDLEGRKTIAFDLASYLKRHFEVGDFTRFERWLKREVTGWGSCDHLCCNVIGALVYRFPELRPHVFRWGKSSNLWLRRASAVSLIPSLRKGRALSEALATADLLLTDPEDYVQKGYG